MGMGPCYACNNCGKMGPEDPPVSMHNKEDQFDLCMPCYTKIYEGENQEDKVYLPALV